MKQLVKPKKLKPGDTVAAIANSAGVASIFPHQYQFGKKQLQDAFGLKVVETPNALRPHEELYNNPQLRADDLMWAFKNPEVKAIISIIGGEDCIRLFPLIDLDVIKNNPKVFMGYSDPTAIHFMCYTAGLSSIYGPTIMAGFGENAGLFPYSVDIIKRTLFSDKPIGLINPSTEWTDELLDWADPNNSKIKRKRNPNNGPHVLQGKEAVQGHLLGGCFEVLLMCLNTPISPALNDWDGAILFIETSEGNPPEDIFLYWLRNLAAQGIIQKINGIIVGRPKDAHGKMDLYEKALMTIARETGRLDLPIMTQMDFGHTDPMFLLPYGAKAEIDPIHGTFKILENAVI